MLARGRLSAWRWRRLIRKVVFYVLAVPLMVVVGLTVIYTVLPPPLTPLMVIRLIEGHGLSRDWQPLEEISPILPRAVIASEDNLYCQHWGIDTEALQNQIERWWAGDRPRGASTISMQATKNLFLWPGRDPLRKALELPLTPLVDTVLRKRRLMEIYLNVVEFGPGIYGAEAAAQHWFKTSAADLGPGQASALAVLLPAPLSYRPGEAHVARQAARVRTRIDQLGPTYFSCVER